MFPTWTAEAVPRATGVPPDTVPPLQEPPLNSVSTAVRDAAAAYVLEIVVVVAPSTPVELDWGILPHTDEPAPGFS